MRVLLLKFGAPSTRGDRPHAWLSTMIGRLSLDEQLIALKSALSHNEVLMEVMSRAAALELPDWYVTAGCLFQTVWNVVTNRPPTSGIKSLGVRLETDGQWRIYAPHGLSDIFNLVVRPNPVLAPQDVYETKTARWRRQWPELTVLDWPRA
jgi:hypothetical protein